jgi:hypothetical protein
MVVVRPEKLIDMEVVDTLAEAGAGKAARSCRGQIRRPGHAGMYRTSGIRS